ncbi:MAG: serine/threonine-protein kinase [Acidimicrobiales bacterium]
MTETLPYELLDERYRLEVLVGRGGMASVYRAVDTRLDREVAIKLLNSGTESDDRRLRAEVRTLARFAHPHLVRLLDAGEVDGRLYLVMDLIDGTTVAARLREGQLPPLAVTTIAVGVSEALRYVHQNGIIHRDVKPANILLDAAGVPYLADFGIARLMDSTALTATGLLVGTPAYLAPEQVHGAEVGPPADVYALGLVLLECLTGRRAFSGGISELAAARVLREPEIPNNLPGPWPSLLRAMTAREPSERPSAAELMRRLSSKADTPTIGVTAPTPDGVTTVVGDTVLEDQTAVLVNEDKTAPIDILHDRPEESQFDDSLTRRRKWTAYGVAALGIVALLAGIVIGQAFSGGKAKVSQQDRASSSNAPTTQHFTTTTLVHPVTLSGASGAFVADLVNGETQGSVTPQATQQLMGQLQSVVTAPQGSTQAVAQFDQLVSSFNRDATSGQIVGSSTLSTLSSALTDLASALGTSVPSPTTTVQAGPAKGRGHGKK